MIVEPRVILSRAERLAYEALWSRTRQGARKWRGVLHVPGLSPEALKTAVKRLRAKGVISAQAITIGSNGGSLFVILRPPPELAVRAGRQSVGTLTEAVKMA